MPSIKLSVPGAVSAGYFAPRYSHAFQRGNARRWVGLSKTPALRKSGVFAPGSFRITSERHPYLSVQLMCQVAESLFLYSIAEICATMLFDLALHIAHVFTFARALSQDQTRGASRGSTLEAPNFPQFLTNNPLPDGFPWGNKTVGSSNPYKEAPDTGVTRQYQFTLARAQKSPDGYLKDLILVNDQFPGPTIEANWGDYIEGQSSNRSQGKEHTWPRQLNPP